jgi:hypothetical protein
MVSQLIAALATTLPLYAIAAPTELCPGKVSWTVTGLHQLDGVQPNPLSGRSDKIRELQFTALSTANGASYTCSGFLFQSSMVVGPPWPDTQQWEAWTPDCHTDHTGDVDVDASFAFRFLSAWAEEKNDTHPAHIALRQNFTCGER